MNKKKQLIQPDMEPEGLDKAKGEAGKMIGNKGRLKSLLIAAGLKLATSKDAMKNTLNDLTTLLKLITAWINGSYTKVPKQSLILAVASIIYFVNPFDVIPDFLLLWGLIDDVVVISFVIRSIKDDLKEFEEWQSAQGEGAEADPKSTSST